ncbi:MAG: GDSL-type esterase/lipase family protein [Alphaproteobacteria bacterium]
MLTSKVCFFGDGTTFGCRDETLLGWPGRLGLRLHRIGRDVACFNMAIRLDTSSDILAHWRIEATRRLPQAGTGGLVFQFGLNDMATTDSGVRVPVDESIGNAEVIIRQAASWRPTLWVGPMPLLTGKRTKTGTITHTFTYHRDHLLGLNDAYGGVAAALGVPYLDLFALLGNDREFAESLERGDGIHPDGRGHEQVAHLVDTWPAWRAWFTQSRMAALA